MASALDYCEFHAESRIPGEITSSGVELVFWIGYTQVTVSRLMGMGRFEAMGYANKVGLGLVVLGLAWPGMGFAGSAKKGFTPNPRKLYVVESLEGEVFSSRILGMDADSVYFGDGTALATGEVEAIRLEGKVLRGREEREDKQEEREDGRREMTVERGRRTGDQPGAGTAGDRALGGVIVDLLELLLD